MEALVSAVEGLRDAVEGARLPLDVTSRAPAEASRRQLLQQLDDYVLPRLRAIDAPLLAVVGGSTGAGKSTLVNSVVGAEVSRSGVLRPTTTLAGARAPPRRPARGSPTPASSPGSRASPARTPARASPAPCGSSESSDAARRAWPCSTPPTSTRSSPPTAPSPTQLLSAADLWLFVTTAARYADAVPWDLLRTAADRGTSVAIVLDRIPADAVAEIRPHLAAMLREQGLPTAPIFTVPETTLDADGRLPADAVERLRSWLAGAGQRRPGPGDRGRPDAARAPSTRCPGAPPSSSSPAATSTTPRSRCARPSTSRSTRRTGGSTQGMTDGTLLRGEVLARWQEFVGTGEFFRQVESTISRWRDKRHRRRQGQPAAGRRPRGGPAVGRRRAAALQRRDRGVRDRPRLAPPARWQPDPHRPPRPGQAERRRLRADVERLVRDWQGEVLELVRTEGQGRRTNARIAAYGLNAIGLFLMLVAFSSTAGLTGAEIGIAGGTAVLAQRVLEAIFGDQAVREMAAKARRSLLDLRRRALRRRARAVCRRARRGGRARRPGAAPRRRRRPGCGRWCGEPVADGLLAAVPSCPPSSSRRPPTALAAAVEAGGDQLPAAERQRADAVVAKVAERTALVGGPHRRRAGRRHRQRQVVAVQRARRRRRWPPSACGARRRRRRRRRSGATSRSATCSTGSASAPGTS